MKGSLARGSAVLPTRRLSPPGQVLTDWRSMDGRRWLNHSHPQTLQIATWLLYFNGVLGLILGSYYFALGVPLGLASLVGCVAAGFGIANERRWGWVLGIVLAILEVLLIVAAAGGITEIFTGPTIISFVFAVALVAALLHPMSRDYQRIWFR